MFKKIIYLLPRVLTVVVAVFFYLFTLEAFSPGFGWQDGLSHFILATAVLAAGILAWKKPLIGGWLYLLPFVVILISGEISTVFGAVAIVGLLYLLDGFTRKKLKRA